MRDEAVRESGRIGGLANQRNIKTERDLLKQTAKQNSSKPQAPLSLDPLESESSTNVVAYSPKPEPRSHNVRPQDGPCALPDQLWALQRLPGQKRGKDNARKEWPAACKRAPPTDIIAAFEQCQDCWERYGYEVGIIPHLSTWLHQSRWQDDLPAPRPGATQGSNGNGNGKREDWYGRRVLERAVRHAEELRLSHALVSLSLKVARRSGEDEQIEARIEHYADQLMAWPEPLAIACLAEHPKRSIYWPAWKELEDLRAEFEAANRATRRTVILPEHRLLPRGNDETDEPFVTKNAESDDSPTPCASSTTLISRCWLETTC